MSSERWLTAFLEVMNEQCTFSETTKKGYVSVVRRCLQKHSARKVGAVSYCKRFTRKDKSIIAGVKWFAKLFDSISAAVEEDGETKEEGDRDSESDGDKDKEDSSSEDAEDADGGEFSDSNERKSKSESEVGCCAVLCDSNTHDLFVSSSPTVKNPKAMRNQSRPSNSTRTLATRTRCLTAVLNLIILRHL
jgi:hypothetical protein